MQSRSSAFTELRNFDQYLDTHPEVAKQVRANPSPVNDPAFLQSHRGLQEFLLLKLAEMLGSVSQACKVMVAGGFSLSAILLCRLSYLEE